MKTYILKKADIYKGSLILVNQTHPINKTVYTNNLIDINLNKNIFLEQKTAACFMRLINDLKCANQIIPISGYRSYEEQKKIYDDSLAANGRKFTEQYVALPDCSEHQTGLAIDIAKKSDKINFLCPDFPNSGVCAEFKKKSSDYGFIQRYTKEKENITGISCEPWHFRYVGIPHAQVINQNSFCLEEYLIFIKEFEYQKKHLKTKINQNEIEIFYIDNKKNECIDLDDGDLIDISGNNKDGFIACVFKEQSVKNKIISQSSSTYDISQAIDNDKLSAPNKKYRAWAEIDIAALCHNAITLKNILPDKCGIMPVLKANAYGHGDIECAKALNNMGVFAFCVATLEEAIRLRKNGIEGDILILGYTSPDESQFITAYQLAQTVVSYNHALALNNKGIKIKTHIKIDTGMHRLGIDYNNIAEIESIFDCKNLEIEGVFSHLSSSDSLAYEDLLFTNMQIKRFFETVSYFQAKRYNIGKLHIQATYGILNYPNLPFDYARAGIALYGALGSNQKSLIKADLRPALTLRARIAEIKNIAAAEFIGYSRSYTAKSEIKIAAVTIGYADGVPRNLDKDFYVLIRGRKAFLVGLICMDQLIVDVTNIPDAKEGDEVTIIGKDGDEEIKCEDLAQKCGTITNEILSRLSPRLDYIFING